MCTGLWAKSGPIERANAKAIERKRVQTAGRALWLALCVWPCWLVLRHLSAECGLTRSSVKCKCNFQIRSVCRNQRMKAKSVVCFYWFSYFPSLFPSNQLSLNKAEGRWRVAVHKMSTKAISTQAQYHFELRLGLTHKTRVVSKFKYLFMLPAKGQKYTTINWVYFLWRSSVSCIYFISFKARHKIKLKLLKSLKFNF